MSGRDDDIDDLDAELRRSGCGGIRRVARNVEMPDGSKRFVIDYQNRDDWE